MSDFSELRAQIQEGRRRLSAFDTAIRDQIGQLTLLDRQIADQLRRHNHIELPPGDPLASKRRQILQSLGTQRSEEAALRQQLQAQEETFHTLGDPQELTRELDDHFPCLLLPLRLQTRFVQVQRIARGFDRENILDISDLPEAKQVIRTHKPPGAQAAPFRLTSLQALSKGDREERKLHKKLRTQIRRGQIEVTARNWLSKAADSQELWIRIYPDEIFTHTFEETLAAAEVRAGQNYWQEIWTFEQRFQNLPPEQVTEEQRHQGYLGPWRALERTYGAARAGWIHQKTRPTNYPPEENDWSGAPTFPEIVVKEDVWTRPPRSFVLPDRFVARLYQGDTFREVIGQPLVYPLALGLDPQNESDEDFTPAGNRLRMPDSIHWLTDFAAAEKIGMAIRVVLSPAEFKDGFDQLIVLGLRHSADEEESRVLIDELLDNHTYKPEGMSFLPKGTPTNNYRQHKSGYQSRNEDAESSMRAFTGPPLYTVADAHRQKPDAQLLAEALGLASDRFKHIEGAEREDTREAALFNTLLWPASWGYYLQQFLQPDIGPAAMAQTRDFFCNYVSGGGILPSLRIHRQPYGFLPTTAFSRWQYPDGEESFLTELHGRVLQPLFAHWRELTSHVRQLSQLSDPTTLSEEFVKLLGLHASSVAYRQRNLLGDSLIGSLLQLSGQNRSNLTQNSLTQSQLVTALQDIGLSLDSTTPLIRNVFQKKARLLNGPAIESSPGSEMHPLHLIAEEEFNRLEWLFSASWQDIRTENLFTEKGIAKPKDLLYLLIRHALLRAYLQTGVSLAYDNSYVQQLHLVDFDFDYLIEGNQLSPVQERFLRSLLRRDIGDALKTEAARQARLRNISNPLSRIAFINSHINKRLQKEINAIEQAYTRQPDKWQHLHQTVEGQPVGDRIEAELADPTIADPALGQLLAMKAALAALMKKPTARLERLFSEHLDLCHFRQDAWMLGLVNQRLIKNRNTHPHGIYLGAYGYLEDLKPGPVTGQYVQEVTELAMARPTSPNRLSKVIIPVLVFDSFAAEEADISEWLAHAYLDLADDPKAEFIIDPVTQEIFPPLRNSPDSEGFLLTPSIDHAKAAAVLRAGYTAHQHTAQGAAEAFAVNLSSDRVRKALFYLNGVQNGQPLAALLGYRFERSLYDDPSSQVLAQFVLDIRNKYPLQADKATDDPSDESILVKEADQVVDGLELLKGFQRGNWHVGLSIPVAARQAIDKLLQRLDDSLDAVNDLQVAESIYQQVKGNTDRAAAALRVLNTGGTFQWPEVIQAPRRGRLLTQRFGIFFPGEGEGGQWESAASPRARIAPGLNRWLGQQLPSSERISILVRTPDDGSLRCPLSELGIQPIDLVYQLQNSIEVPVLSEFAQRVRHWAREQHGLRADLTLEIDLAEDGTDAQYGLYELLPLIRNLWSLLENSRQLRPTDLQPETDQGTDDRQPGGDLDVAGLMSRLDRVIRNPGGDSFAQAVSQLQDQTTQLAALDPAATEVADLQVRYDALFDALLSCAAFGIEKAVPNQTSRYTEAATRALLEQAWTLIPELESIQQQVTSLLDRAAAAPDAAEQIDRLREGAHIIFGEAFLITPAFHPANEDELNSALEYPDLLKDAGPFAFAEWMQGIVQVRPAVQTYHRIRQLREALGLASEHRPPELAQLPFHPAQENRWVGIALPEGYELDSDVLSLLLDLPDNYLADTLQAGLLIDQWKEVIPERTIEAGIALQHNQPNTEAPQSVLLAVSPRQQSGWAWDDLMVTVRETMTLAKMRLVTPEIIDKHSPLSHLLPAVLPAVIDTDRGPNLDLTRNMRTPLTLPPFVLDSALPTTGTIQIDP